MDLQIIKETLIKRIESVEDIALLNALNNMVEYGLKKKETEPAFLASLEQSLEQSAHEGGKPHQEVIQDLHKKYVP